MITVMYLVPEMISGGVEINTVEFANFMAKKGHKIFIVTSRIELKHLLNYKVNILIQNIATKNPFKIIFNAILLVFLVKKYYIQVLHVKSRAPAVSAFLAKKILYLLYKQDLKLVSTFHGLYGTNTYLKYLYASFMVKVDLVIAVSDRVRDYILNNFLFKKACDVVTINRGVDVDQYSIENIPKEDILDILNIIDGHAAMLKKVILFPGRLSKNKGHFWMLKALEKLKRDDFLCVIATGSSPKSSTYEKIVQTISDYNLQQKVRIIHKAKSIKALYMISTFAVCLSSKEESFGRIPIESASLMIPCLATNMGTFRKTIVDGHSGWLIDLWDVDGLSAKINEILNMTEGQLVRYGISAREFVNQHFNIEDTFSKTEQEYIKLVNSLNS